jgi:hypothetical protein
MATPRSFSLVHHRGPAATLRRAFLPLRVLWCPPAHPVSRGCPWGPAVRGGLLVGCVSHPGAQLGLDAVIMRGTRHVGVQPPAAAGLQLSTRGCQQPRVTSRTPSLRTRASTAATSCSRPISGVSGTGSAPAGTASPEGSLPVGWVRVNRSLSSTAALSPGRPRRRPRRPRRRPATAAAARPRAPPARRPDRGGALEVFETDDPDPSTLTSERPATGRPHRRSSPS